MVLPLRRTLVLGLALVLIAAAVPAGWWLERTITRELSDRVREDLGRAPLRMERQDEARGDALMMHAQEVAALPGLAAAVARGDRAAVASIVTEERIRPGEVGVVVDSVGDVWVGPSPSAELLREVRTGKSPVSFSKEGGELFMLSLAPLWDQEGIAGPGSSGVDTGEDGAATPAAAPGSQAGEHFVGAAGVAMPIDSAAVATLSAITASEVVVVDAESSDAVIGSTLSSDMASAIAAASASPPSRRQPDSVREIQAEDRTFWLVSSALGSVAQVIFAVDVEEELAVLPRLRRGAILGGGIAIVLALALGSLLAAAVARPVGSLATAADRLAHGDFDAPLPRTRLTEVQRVSGAFEGMRRALETRIRDLATAYAEVEEREGRLRALQSEMIQRDRLAAAGRLVAELAHEIRNPVANVRNCVEVVRRSLPDDSEARNFADLAIEELLRMHELAERMLDLDRPEDPSASVCVPGRIVRRVAEVLSTGEQGERWPVEVTGEIDGRVAISPDILKQVLLGIVHNAREAMPDGGPVEIHLAGPETEEDTLASIYVRDEGGGIPPEILPKIFDPFFTTKDEARGVGLGLFIADGLLRRVGGGLAAANRENGRGAEVSILLPMATVEAGGSA